MLRQVQIWTLLECFIFLIFKSRSFTVWTWQIISKNSLKKINHPKNLGNAATKSKRTLLDVNTVMFYTSLRVLKLSIIIHYIHIYLPVVYYYFSKMLTQLSFLRNVKLSNLHGIPHFVVIPSWVTFFQIKYT